MENVTARMYLFKIIVILGDIEIDHLRRRLAETEATMDRIVKQMNLVSMTLAKPLNEVRGNKE